jgi:hypothetical protein
LLFCALFFPAFVLFFASRSRVRKREKSAGTHLWLSGINRKLPPHMVMTSSIKHTRPR